MFFEDNEMNVAQKPCQLYPEIHSSPHSFQRKLCQFVCLPGCIAILVLHHMVSVCLQTWTLKATSLFICLLISMQLKS